jgi:hypothetical protein
MIEPSPKRIRKVSNGDPIQQHSNSTRVGAHETVA